MGTEALKSTSITNLDTLPWIPGGVAGAGAPGRLVSVNDSLTATTAKDSGSVYQLVRLPSNVYLKHLFVSLDTAISTFTGDIGAYYSDATNDGTAVANQGLVIDADRFGSAVVMAAIVTPTDYINESGTMTAAKRNQPLWQACGLTSDPGGKIDICITLTATSSGAAVVNVEAQYIPGVG